jgi:hypothetical protein
MSPAGTPANAQSCAEKSESPHSFWLNILLPARGGRRKLGSDGAETQFQLNLNSWRLIDSEIQI